MKCSLRSCALRMVILFTAVAVVACDSPQSTIDTLRSNIAAYPSRPTEDAAAAIEVGFNRLDTQIANLQSAGRDSDVAVLRQQRDDLRTEYTSARVSSSLLKAKRAAEGLGEAVRRAGETLGDAFKGVAGTPAGKDSP